MVRFTHHDMGFHGWDMAHATALDGARCRDEDRCHADRREASRRASSRLHRAIREMVRFTHHDMGFH